MIVGEVVPAVPAAGAIISFLGACLVLGLVMAADIPWRAIFRPTLISLSKKTIVRVHPFGFLGTVVENVDRWIDAAKKSCERAMVWSLNTLMWTFSTTARLTADLAQAVWARFEFTRHEVLPGSRAKQATTFQPRIKRLEREYKGIDQRLDKFERREQAKRAAGAAAGAQDVKVVYRGIDDVRRRLDHLERELKGIEHGQAHVGTRVKPQAVPVPRTRPRAVPRTKAPTRHWTDIFTKSAAAAAVSYALARLGLGWLRCRNTKLFNQRVCRTNPFAWDDLFAGLILLMGTASVEEFAREAQAGFKFGLEGFQLIIRETKDFDLSNL